MHCMICISKHMQVGLSPDGSIALFSYNMCAAASRMLYCTINNIPATAEVRPVRWSFFLSDGMVNVFFQGTIGINGFSMVLPALNHNHLMFFDQPTIDFNGFSMVFRLFRTMVNDGLETPKLQNVRKFNSQQNVFSQDRRENHCS